MFDCWLCSLCFLLFKNQSTSIPKKRLGFGLARFTVGRSRRG
jgi:hypothetical protein